MCWFSWQAEWLLRWCHMHTVEKVPRTANAPLQKLAWEFYFLFLFLFFSSSSNKISSCWGRKSRCVCFWAASMTAWSQFNIAGIFSSIICAAPVYGGPIIEFSFCLLHYGSMQPVSSCLPPLLPLLLCYPSPADTRSISVAFQTDVAGNKIHPFFSFLHQLLHSSILSFPSFLSLISVELALSRTLPLPAVHAGNLFTVDLWRLKTPLCDTKLICLNPHNNQAQFA